MVKINGKLESGFRKWKGFRKCHFVRRTKSMLLITPFFPWTKTRRECLREVIIFCWKKTKMKWKPQKNKIQETSIFKASQQLVYEFRGHIQRCIKKSVKYIWCSPFTKKVNSWKLLTIFTEKCLCRYLTGF